MQACEVCLDLYLDKANLKSEISETNMKLIKKISALQTLILVKLLDIFEIQIFFRMRKHDKCLVKFYGRKSIMILVPNMLLY